MNHDGVANSAAARTKLSPPPVKLVRSAVNAFGGSAASPPRGEIAA